MVATGGNALRELGPLARSDFSAGALWLAQMELAAASGLHVRRVFLHPQLTEIALAGRVPAAFGGVARRGQAPAPLGGAGTPQPGPGGGPSGGRVVSPPPLVASRAARGCK